MCNRSVATGGSENWQPIPDFSRDDADISMFFFAPNSKFN